MQQVLMRRVGSGAPRFDLLDNPKNLAPLAFEKPREGVRVPRLGTQDLLAIASFATRTGYRIDGFIIEDRSFTRVSDDLEETVSDALAKTLEEEGVFQAAVLADETWDVYVTGVKLTTADLRTVTLLRQGAARSAESFDIRQFLSGAWTAVHFS